MTGSSKPPPRATSRTARQLVDLQNRITELSERGALGELTEGEIALISYALGLFTAKLLEEPPPPPDLDQQLKSLSTMRRAAKKAGVKA